MSQHADYDKCSSDVKFLDERDPIKGTQTAYINMHGRRAAIKASFATKKIFGMKVNIQLAVERAE